MYCKHCGKQIDDNSQFCKFCGKQLTETKNVVIEFSMPNAINTISHAIEKKQSFPRIYNKFRIGRCYKKLEGFNWSVWRIWWSILSLFNILILIFEFGFHEENCLHNGLIANAWYFGIWGIINVITYLYYYVKDILAFLDRIK